MTSLTTLLALADSRLPTGGHVHSGGVEEAVTSGLVVDLGTLRAFLRRRIATHGLVDGLGGRGGACRLATRSRPPIAKPMPAHRLPRPAGRPARRVAAWPGWRAGCGPPATGTHSVPHHI